MTTPIEWHRAAWDLIQAAEDVLRSGPSGDPDALDRLAAHWAAARLQYARIATAVDGFTEVSVFAAFE